MKNLVRSSELTDNNLSLEAENARLQETIDWYESKLKEQLALNYKYQVLFEEQKSASILRKIARKIKRALF